MMLVIKCVVFNNIFLLGLEYRINVLMDVWIVNVLLMVC